MARPPRIPYGYCPTFGQYSEYILLLDSKGIVEFRKINDLYASSRGIGVKTMCSSCQVLKVSQNAEGGSSWFCYGRGLFGKKKIRFQI